MKKLVYGILIALLLTGCKQEEELVNLANIEPADNTAFTPISHNTAITKSDREQLIYQQIADRTLVDVNSLEEIDSEDKIILESHIQDICDKIEGVRYNSAISDEFVNYLLFEMQKTPYRWYRDNISILGIDKESQSYIIDVTFKTNTEEYKTIIDNSAIPIGSHSYGEKTKVRLARYLEILNNKAKGYDDIWVEELEEFERVYGSVDSLINSQADYTLIEKARKGEFVTYEGLVDSAPEKSGATMTVRFVFKNEFVLGVSMGITCKHMYLVNYTLGVDPLGDKETLELEEGALAGELDRLVYSHNRAVDGDNFEGLNKIVYEFGKFDKHYKDMFNTSYRKVNGYAINVHEIDNTKITLGLVRIHKIRAKGSDMSYPVYEEKWLYEIELIDDRLQVVNNVLVSSSLVGEPSIVSEGTEGMEGFVSAVHISERDKKGINETLNKFNQVQVNYDTASTKFIEVVDMGMLSEDLAILKNNITAFEGVTKKVSWVKSYNSAYTNYVNLTMLEVYFMEDGTALEAESDISVVYSLSLGWKVMDYQILNNISIDASSVGEETAFSVVEKEIKEEIVESEPDEEVDSEDNNEEQEEEGTTRLPSVLDIFGN